MGLALLGQTSVKYPEAGILSELQEWQDGNQFLQSNQIPDSNAGRQADQLCRDLALFIDATPNALSFASENALATRTLNQLALTRQFTENHTSWKPMWVWLFDLGGLRRTLLPRKA